MANAALSAWPSAPHTPGAASPAPRLMTGPSTGNGLYGLFALHAAHLSVRVSLCRHQNEPTRDGEGLGSGRSAQLGCCAGDEAEDTLGLSGACEFTVGCRSSSSLIRQSLLIFLCRKVNGVLLHEPTRDDSPCGLGEERLAS